MKKFSFFLVGMLFSTYMTFGQGNGQTTGNGTGNNNGSFWRLDGNAGTDIAKPHFIGTVDMMGVAFRTNDVEHMRITAAGDVGIGIDIPLAKLHVVGDVIIDGLLSLSGDLDLGGNLSVAGNTLLNGTLGVGGNTSLGADLNVAGNTTLAGTLSVGSTSSFGDDVGITGNLDVSGGVTTSAFAMPSGASNGYVLLSDALGNASWQSPDVFAQTLTWNAGANQLSISSGNTVNLSDMLQSISLNQATNTLSVSEGGSVNLDKYDNGWVYGSGSNLYYTGNVAIGANTYATGFKLSVDGKVACEEVLVDLSGNWPDYVFATDYPLLDIHTLANYIKAENHLPGVPTAEEVAENGIEIGEMQRVMMEKIEELTLYVIAQQETIEALKAEVETLKSEEQ
jgi:hypothetical protein